MPDIETKLKDTVKGLLAEGKVDLVVSYEKGTLPRTSRPAFIRSADDVDRLVWNDHCFNNLAVYLPGLFERPAHLKPDQQHVLPTVGIVAKGCDARSIVGLIKEHQLPRENVVIVAVPCAGMASRQPSAHAGDEDALDDACLQCTHPTAEDADVVIEGEGRAAGDRQFDKVDEFEAMSADQRWQRFTAEISKCIRCYACRQACPNCYCKVCFADQTKPSWVGAGDELSDLMLYHIGRMFHQAGRCVACDACVRACPMDIDLRLFTQKLVKDVEDLFGYVPGMSLEEPPPLCTFQQDDSECFITEPQED